MAQGGNGRIGGIGGIGGIGQRLALVGVNPNEQGGFPVH